MKFWIGSYSLSVNVAEWAGLQQALVQRFEAHQGFALATLNMDHLEKLRRDEAFRQAYRAQDLVVADGNPIVWMSRLAGRPVDLMPGSDLVLPITTLCAAHQVPIALIGSQADALSRAAEALRAENPDLKIAYQHAPKMGFDPMGEEAVDILNAAQDAGARVCLLALGAPKQERFAARGRQLTPDLGFVSIGAGLDFLAGTQTRAPRWVRQMAMEWLWRMLGNPARLASRYAKNFAILPGHVMRSKLRSQE
ncbi:WecB/TagA/CpsF family glycosyltransferase [Thalassobius sp. Cn5-15]|uniref:WecB/TagA/CpsF family glycosyltransferase n=1 Tax=Thalassobius sp. Cn5-15 TaxID=2917763 RepID=UPI001EF26FB6|nr:WecB/TagA/CpsF family glycosyltransferase [Thalassobius sp. Cn5-15]MCG7494049.1 WecB/TagA/CpsF family glycosyltransferase [Thalassobius sp. Cn5-15]